MSRLYADIFTRDVVFEPVVTREQVQADLERRGRLRIPPGYKDAGKKSNSAGDLVIWHSILELGQAKQKDLLFVSGDEKGDWWHRSEGQSLYPRFELVEEYRQVSGGRSFHIARFSEFLDLFGVQAQVVSEVRQEETAASLEQRSSADTSSNFIGRAITGVLMWIAKRFPDHTVDMEFGPTYDLLLSAADGSGIGIEVVITAELHTSAVVSRVLSVIERSQAILPHERFSRFLICVPFQSTIAARRFVARFGDNGRSVPREIGLSVGVLSSDEYVEVWRSAEMS